MKYSIVYYCHILPTWTIKESGLNIEEAERELKAYVNKKKYDRTKMDCCQYFIQSEE